MNKFRTMLLGTAAAGVAAAGSFTPTPADAGGINSGNDKVKVTISGQVATTATLASDDESTRVNFGDNQFSGSKFRIIGIAKGSETLTVGARIEWETQQQDSNESGKNQTTNTNALVTGTNSSGTVDMELDLRWADTWLQHKTFGKLSLGRGDAADNGTSEADLSGTIMARPTSQGDHFGGWAFRSSGSGKPVTTSTVGRVFGEIDGLSRTQRIRYDTPTWHGFRLAVSSSQGDRTSVAGFYAGDIKGWKLAVRAGYSHTAASSTTQDGVLSGSASVLAPFGLNLTVNGGWRDRRSGAGRDPKRFGVKLGYKAKLLSFGKTNFAVDYGRYQDTCHSQITGSCSGTKSTGDTIGFAVAQDMDAWSTQLLAQFSYFELDDNSATRYEDVVGGMIGTFVKF